MNELDFRNIDRSTWKKYRFEEIADSISERVEPGETDLDIYVGLEHLDAESLHIKRTGVPSDVKGTKLKVYKGDVIFGKRRAYQRKAAIAHFDGICSAHAMVLRAKSKVIHPQLFPFFIHSDYFMHRAIDISVGGLSPTINWGTLKTQEFLLPPQDQQAKLAEILWAADDVTEKVLLLKERYLAFFERYLNDSIDGIFSPTHRYWKEHLFGDLGEIFGGLNGKSKDDFGKGKPFITYMNIFSNRKININDTALVNITTDENQNEVKYGDIFFTASSETPQEVGMSSVLLDEVNDMYLNSFCFGFRLHNFNTLIPDYAKYLFRSNSIRKFMHLHAQGSTRFNLSKSTVKTKLIMNLPDVKEQVEIVKKIERREPVLYQIKNQISQLKQIQKQLINQIFS